MNSDSENTANPGPFIEGDAASFQELFQSELDHMATRPDATHHDKDQLVGLAISGGGIRSAVFALGVLQSLALHDQLKKIDYLSTVSGGGYIGTAFSWLLHRFWNEVEDDQQGIRYSVGRTGFPFATSPRDLHRNRDRNQSLINFMRRNRQYLLPGDGIGVFSLLAAILRGIILNALVFLPFIVAAFVGLQLLGELFVTSNETAMTAGKIVEHIPARMMPVADGWALQINMGILLIALTLAVFACYFAATIFYALRTIWSRGANKATYGYRRLYDSKAASLLSLSLALAILGSVPFVAAYLDNPAVGAGAAGGGLVAGLLAFWKTRANVLKRLPMPVLVWVGSSALIYGILLIGLYLCRWLTDSSGLGQIEVAGVMAVALGVALLLGLLVDLNLVSMHRFYRDRLMETFMPDPRKVIGRFDVVDQAVLADKTPLSAICRYQKNSSTTGGKQTAGALGPYHLINSNVILTDSRNKTLRARGGDSFLLSPLYCGSASTGWRDTTDFSENRVTLPTAMAVSGAAVNPDVGPGGDGPTRNPALSTFMRLLNLRLGYWVPNPDEGNRSGMKVVDYRPSILVEGLMPTHQETAGALELSDGGHFDNLALYELIRRKVQYIILLDAAADRKFGFADFANLLEKIRADFGVTITGLELDKLVPKMDPESKLPLAEQGVVSGEIVYSETRKGRLFYVKTTMIEDLPEDIYGYWRSHRDFPDETTADQFFDEKQFEAYRELGYQLGNKLEKAEGYEFIKQLSPS